MALLLALAVKWPCSRFIGREAFTRFCYTDIVALYYQHSLQDHKLPYVQVWIEYPVLTGVFMWLTVLPTESARGFFLLNVAGLAAAATVTAVLLFRLVGTRAWYFVAAPSLMLLAFINWDLLPVALSTAAVFAHLKNRQGLAGILLGLGVATKFYPILLLVPIAMALRHRGETLALTRLVIAAGIAWVVSNAYLAIAGTEGWAYFYRANGTRGIDGFALASFACRVFLGKRTCGTGHPEVTALMLLALITGSLLVWLAKRHREPDFKRWTLGFPILVVFLLTSKVYSPQYSLWLLPWFPLVLPDLRLFVAFEAADVAVFFTTFSWLGSQFGFGGLTEGFALIAVAARGAILLACICAYTVRPGSQSVLPSFLRAANRDSHAPVGP